MIKKSATEWVPPKGVSVFPRKDRGTWVVAYRVAQPGQGKRKLVKETFETKGLATDRARQVADELKIRGESGLRSLTGAALADYERILHALDGATVENLLTIWSRHKHEIVARPPLPIGDAIRRYFDLRLAAGDWGKDTARHVRLHLSRLCEEFEGKSEKLEDGAWKWSGGEDVASVEKSDIVDWLSDISETHKTCWPHQKDAAAFFGRAFAEKWIGSDPTDGIPRPKKEDEEVSVISVEDAKKLFAANRDEPVVARLALEAFGGLRASSSHRLLFSEIKWDERAILLPGKKHKSKKRHYTEGMPSNLWEWLLPWKDVPEAWEFSESQLMHAKSAAVKRAGLVLPKNVLRHSFASYHIALHRNGAETALLMQHRDQEMLYEHYRGHAAKPDAEAYFGITPARLLSEAE